MKTLKFLLATFVMLFFFSSNLFAQKEKISERFNLGPLDQAFCFCCI